MLRRRLPRTGPFGIACPARSLAPTSPTTPQVSEGEIGNVNDILRTGNDIVAAGYCMYGAATELVMCFKAGKVERFALDPSLGEFIHTDSDMRIPEGGGKKIYSCNEGNCLNWDKEIIDAVQAFKEKGYAARYVGSMVSDVHRTILYGGCFIYPADKKSVKGKLRVLYEGFPMALIVESAGGKATTGMFNGSVQVLRAPETTVALGAHSVVRSPRRPTPQPAGPPPSPRPPTLTSHLDLPCRHLRARRALPRQNPPPACRRHRSACSTSCRRTSTSAAPSSWAASATSCRSSAVTRSERRDERRVKAATLGSALGSAGRTTRLRVRGEIRKTATRRRAWARCEPDRKAAWARCGDALRATYAHAETNDNATAPCCVWQGQSHRPSIGVGYAARACANTWGGC